MNIDRSVKQLYIILFNKILFRQTWAFIMKVLQSIDKLTSLCGER